MNEIISVSFSDNSYQYVISKDGHIVDAQDHPFVTFSSYENLFDDIHLKEVSSKLSEVISVNQFKDAEIFITIPFNFSLFKKISVPPNSTKKEKREQINWELTSILPEPLSFYKISTLRPVELSDDIEEINVIAIPRKIIEQCSGMINQLQAKFSGLLINVLSLENFLNSTLNQNTPITIFAKIAQSISEIHVYYEKNYLVSFFENVDSESESDKIVELLKEKMKKVSSLIEQKYNAKINTSDILLYGSNMDSDKLSLFKQNLTANVELASFKFIPPEISYKYIEAIGSIV